MESSRLPRFKRSSQIAPLRLTDRDREILKHVHRHRFLRSDHLVTLLPGSRQQVLRRLQRLYHHGFLERPRCQIDYYQTGSRRIAYGLGNKGSALLKRELALPYYQLDWRQKGPVGRLFLEHALMVSDVMVALEMACRKQAGIRLLSPDESKLPGIVGRKREPFQWTVNIGGRLKCGVIPDRVFGLETLDKSGKRDRTWFFLEADRATMPVTRVSLAPSSFYRKLLAYEATWTQNVHRTRFGWPRFRVLTVTTSTERVQHLLDACRRLERGHGLFLFMELTTFKAKSDILALRWRTCRGGESTGLLD